MPKNVHLHFYILWLWVTSEALVIYTSFLGFLKGTKRMGGGKGNIHHYTTPVKAGRIILEIGGKCEYFEVQALLEEIAHNLPFPARAVSQDMFEADKRREAWEQDHNHNLFTFEYMVRNNMLGCHNWITPFDTKWFGKYR
jgi:large subunit ribosomal protein L16